jgi:hypothetical protein
LRTTKRATRSPTTIRDTFTQRGMPVVDASSVLVSLSLSGETVGSVTVPPI